MSDTSTGNPYFQVLVDVCRAVAEHDVDAALRHFAQDCVFVDGATGSVTDRQGFLDFLTETWKVTPDYLPTPVVSHTVGDTIAVIFEATGTPVDAESAAPGRRLRWPISSFSTFDENRRIVRDVYFVDQHALDQLLLGAESGTAPAAVAD